MNATASPGDWSDAANISVMPRDPDYAHVVEVISASDIPEETTDIESLTPNTLYFTVNSDETYSSTSIRFVDAPIGVDELKMNTQVRVGTNLFTMADYGNFGYLPNGTAVQTSPSSAPVEAGGYIWHTTGSGKTLTSFKTAQLATYMPHIDKVLFVVEIGRAHV